MKRIAVVMVILIFIGFSALLFFSNSNNKTTPTKTSSRHINTVMITPNEVVENYTNATLGTLPNASVDYQKAKTYLDDNLRSQFTDDSFVPQSYGIQQGPDDVSIEVVYKKEDEAKVLVEAYYGEEMALAWLFSLTRVNGEWKISTIEEYQP
jgi:hypothetical protein